MATKLIPNSIKYIGAAGQVGNCLRKSNYAVAINPNAEYGSSLSTGFWSGITPPASGYMVYMNKAANGPSIYQANTDADLIHLANLYAGGTLVTIADALNFFAGQPDTAVVNRDYEGIVIDSSLIYMNDPSHTLSYPKGYSTLYDVSGMENDLTFNNSPTFDASGLAINYAGGNQFLQGTAINCGQNFTLICWFNSSIASGRGGLIANAYPYSTNQGFYMFIRTTLEIAISIGQDQAVGVSANNLISDGSWCCVAITVANGGLTITGYKNNVVFPWSILTQTNVPINYSTTNTFILGKTAANSTDYYIGRMGIVQIYNRVLSTAELTQNWTAQKSIYGL